MIDFAKIDRLKQELDSYRPLPQEVVKNLHDDLVLRWTYNSNAIEGSTLSLKETKVVLEGITVGGKTLREHLEAVNHREAILFIEELSRGAEPLTGHHVKLIHRLILQKIDDNNAGTYRRVNVVISGAEHIPPDYTQVESEMERFICRCHEQADVLHPVERAAIIHSDFVKIHPFTDGNGRTARLLMNLELMKSGLPPVVLPVEMRLEYYEALDRAHTKGDFSAFMALTVSSVEQGFEPYWRALGIKESGRRP